MIDFEKTLYLHAFPLICLQNYIYLIIISNTSNNKCKYGGQPMESCGNWLYLRGENVSKVGGCVETENT